MLSHNSPELERAAGQVHIAWALFSFLQADCSLGAAYMFFPYAGTDALIQSYFLGLEFVSMGIVVFGFAGTIFHIWGAREHFKNAAKLGQ